MSISETSVDRAKTYVASSFHARNALKELYKATADESFWIQSNVLRALIKYRLVELLEKNKPRLTARGKNLISQRVVQKMQKEELREKTQEYSPEARRFALSVIWELRQEPAYLTGVQKHWRDVFRFGMGAYTSLRGNEEDTRTAIMRNLQRAMAKDVTCNSTGQTPCDPVMKPV